MHVFSTMPDDLKGQCHENMDVVDSDPGILGTYTFKSRPKKVGKFAPYLH